MSMTRKLVSRGGQRPEIVLLICMPACADQKHSQGDTSDMLTDEHGQRRVASDWINWTHTHLIEHEKRSQKSVQIGPKIDENTCTVLS
jgi:hypothetical protein